ncbi:MAG: metallophosphoesterase [Ferruginibacter sp.]
MMRNIIAGILFLLTVLDARSQQEKKSAEDPREQGVFKTDIPPHPCSILLAQPTDNAVRLSIMMNEEATGYVQFGQEAGKLNRQTPVITYEAGKPATLILDNLPNDRPCYYRFLYKSKNGSKEEQTALHSFFLQRRKGASFSFCIQADSHLDENTSADAYLKTLTNISNDTPDFLIDLGDTWMTDKYRNNFKEALAQYRAQRYYFAQVGQSAPVFFTLGNHDGETGGQGKKNGGENNMLSWSTLTRNNYYLNPAPDGFYSGNTTQEDGIGFPRNYYAWQWGDALFIVLDPFRYSTGNKSPWQRTLGQTQYQWLKKTLEESRACFKFVFIHNLVGGVDKKGKGRGGAEASRYYEWGGYDTSGVNRFAENRPGWAQPIHDLLVANHVNIVFHGHDHFFAKQEKDGIIYQLVPQPGATHYGNTNLAADYGYHEGTLLNTPGYLRVSVNKLVATVDYIQTSTDNKHKNGEVLFSYSIKADK